MAAPIDLRNDFDSVSLRESENGKLKKLLAETMLDNAGLKGLLAKTSEACKPPGSSHGSLP